MQGFARYINASCATKNRCLAGRKLVVDFYDSHLNPNETRNAEIQACTNDFAMVGTSAVLLDNVDDMRNCKDRAGATTGIPDIPFVDRPTRPAVLRRVLPGRPVGDPLRHEGPAPPDLRRQRRPRLLLHEEVRRPARDLRLRQRLEAGRDDQFASGDGGLRDLGGIGKGIRSDGDFDMSATAPQSHVHARRPGDEGQGLQLRAVHAASTTCTVLLRKEAALQGVTDQVKVWDCGAQCYDKKFLQTGGADVEHEYVDTLFLPFYDPQGTEGQPDARQLRQVHRQGQGRRLRRPTPGRRPSPSVMR